MNVLTDLEKKINSELTSKISSSMIKHNQLYLNKSDIDCAILLRVIMNYSKNNELSLFIDFDVETIQSYLDLNK